MNALLPGWEDLDARRKQPSADGLIPLPIDVAAAAGTIHTVASADEAASFVGLLRSAKVSAIALRLAFASGRASLRLHAGGEWTDIRSQRPHTIALAGLLIDAVGHRAIVRATLDVRGAAGTLAFAETLALRVPLIAHGLKPVLFAAWALGLDPTMPAVFDTSLAAGCLQLGQHHRRGSLAGERPGLVQAADERRQERDRLLSLEGQCARYGLGYPHSGTASAAESEGPWLVDDAEWTLRLYLAQQNDLVTAGLHSHLESVEFPFALANARIEWNGVPVSHARLRTLAAAAKKASAHYAGILKRHRIDPPGSREQLLRLLQREGLTRHVLREGRASTEDDVLESVEHLHPAIRAFRLHGRYRRIAGEEWLTGVTLAADGRLHPEHIQLGAATGRNSCSSPNLAGLGRVLRPVVVAPPGRALVELDYAQIEVGIAAAEHDDPDLIAAYNSGDVYSAMAQRFYAAQLTEVERGCAPDEFKRRRPDLRDRMKTFVLAVLYNIQAPAIALRFGITHAEAEKERSRFLDLYPRLRERLEGSALYGAARGYATLVSGLRRHRPIGGAPRRWTHNFLRNTPIQGSAAVVFKKAVVLLDQEFRGTTTLLVLPVHDSILIECDAASVDEVCEGASVLMRHALRGYYPKLQPRIDVNKADVTCWNKDGHGESLERFLDDPEIRIEQCGRATSGVLYRDRGADVPILLTEPAADGLDAPTLRARGSA